MAYGTELMFVLDEETVKRYATEALGGPDGLAEFQKEFDGDDGELLYEYTWRASALLESRLQEVHLRLIRERFDPEASMRDSGRYIVANTTAGRREFSTFSIGLHGDEEGPQTIGISILSRYFPVWLDWRERHGGSHLPIIFNDETIAMSQTARYAITEVIPEIENAPLASVFCHY